MGLLILSLLLAQRLLPVPSLSSRLVPEEFNARMEQEDVPEDFSPASEHEDIPAEFIAPVNHHVSEESPSPLEFQREHFGLVDDYGIRPQYPKYQIRKLRKESEKLHKSHKSKRDEPNFEEYYDDDLL